MKSITNTINAIHADIETSLPPILDTHGVAQFEKYVIGYPVDDKKVLLCVRAASGSDDAKETFVFNIHAQLPGVSEAGAYSYIDAVNEYLDSHFDPQVGGYTDGGYTFAMTDNFRTSTIEVFWDVSLTRPKDDCG